MNIHKARALRKNMTDAERRLWRQLRQRQLGGFKFRRQLPLGPYIVDFICLEARLIIELDGGQHQEQEAYDQARDEWLQRSGYRVLRFWNNEVFENMEGVLQRIDGELGGGLDVPPHPVPPPQGWRGPID